VLSNESVVRKGDYCEGTMLKIRE